MCYWNRLQVKVLPRIKSRRHDVRDTHAYTCHAKTQITNEYAIERQNVRVYVSITHLRAATDASVYIPAWAPSRPCQCSYWLSWLPFRPPSPRPPPVYPSSSVSGRCWESEAAAVASFLRLLPRSGWALGPRLHGADPRRPRCVMERWRMSSRCSPQSPRPAGIPARRTASLTSLDREAGDLTPSWRWKWIRLDPQINGGAGCNKAPWCGQALTVDLWS